MSAFNRKALVALRKERGFTQVALAYATGISEWELQAWERGKHAPRGENLQRLATALGCQPEDLCYEQPTGAHSSGGVPTGRKKRPSAKPKRASAS